VPPTRDPLIEASLDLAWSHWGALGVRGTVQPPNTAVDPEALLYFTSSLIDHDPRLRDEVADWWQKYEQHVSRARLTALAPRFGERIASKFEKFLETLRSPARTSGKSRLEHLNTPACSLLKMRCAFGTNARAEILLELLTHRAQLDYGLTALALSEVGYSKRNIAFVLENLVLGGLLVAANEGNRVRYRLADPEGLERVLRPLPSAPGRWPFRLSALAVFVDLAERLRGRDTVVQGIEARKTLEEIMPNLVRAGVMAPAPTVIAESYWLELQKWLVTNVIAEEGDSDRRIAGMVEGVWARPGQEPQRPERYSSAVLPRASANPRVDVELLCLDLVQVPTVEPVNDWVWAVLSTAATNTYAHTIGLNDRERWHFVSWPSGTRRTYAVEYAEPIRHTSISRTYGKLAAARSRSDHPSVQLRLKLVD
jgi:hypothetical protein